MRTMLLSLLAASCVFGQFFPFPGPGRIPGGAGGGATITLVQSKSYASTAAATSHTITLTGAPTNNNTLIMVVTSDSTVTTPAGWTLAISAVDFVGHYIYYRTASSTAAAIVVAPTASANMVINVAEYSGIITASQLDKTATSLPAASVTSWASGTTATTAQTSELIVYTGGYSITGTLPTLTSWSAGTGLLAGYTTNATGDKVAGVMAIQIVSATGAYTSTVTVSDFVNHPSGAVATFKGA